MRGKIVLTVSFILLILILIIANTSEGKINNNDVSLNSNVSAQPKDSFSKSADTLLIEMKTKGIELSYSVSEIRAKAGSILHIKYSNESDMSHNIVFVKGEESIRPVGLAAPQAMATNWVPKSEMNRILAYSELVYSGDTTNIYFEVPSPGTYPYICTYSAHWTQMQGRLISE